MEVHEVTDHLIQFGYLPQHSAHSYFEIQDAIDRYKNFNRFTLAEVGGNLGKLFETPRCGCPDPQGPIDSDGVPESSLELLGSGSWPHDCHTPGIHEVRIKIDYSRMPSFLEPIIGEILDLVKSAYLTMGMTLSFVESGPVNIDFSFERLRGSTIGLARVPNNPGCSSRIWCKYDPGYQPSDLINQWARLIAHELGHNMGLHHTRGGVMNSSILSGVFDANEWVGDPSERFFKAWFGGHEQPQPPPSQEISFAMVKAGDSFYMSGGDLPAELKVNGQVYKGSLRKLT